MATLVLSAAGQAAGAALGGPFGAAVGSYLGAQVGGLVDGAIFGGARLPDAVGPRLDNLKVQTSAYGQFIPQLFGTMRLGGNVIWATDIREVENRTEQSTGGGKGSGGTSQTTVSFEYFATLAIAICEGPIDEVIRVWADSKILTIDDLQDAQNNYEVHLGAEDQLPSAIIQNLSDDATEVPAYRGTAYIVLQDFPLADYGNRIPNFTFEVRRTVRPKPAVEDKVTAITLIPGSGEFVYSPTPSYKYSITTDENGNPVRTGTRTNANVHNVENVANVKLALDQMQDALPNLEWVALVLNWFITSKHLDIAEVIPKVEDKDNLVEPFDWQVGVFNRDNAQEVLRFADGTLTYGGTPTDRSIIDLCVEMKARGLKVLLYPMPLVDTTAETPGEDDKPWRGRLTPDNAAEVASFFNKPNGYNDYIRHYSQLSVDGTDLKSFIDAFVIGTEMIGMTTYDAGGNVYPAVDEFVTLAGLVKGDLAGAGLNVQVTYAADWSEYHSDNGYFHLDALWASPNIDFVGIDNYMPLTPDLDQRDITEERIRHYWEDGEGWEYFYTDANARTGRTDYTPNDGTSPFAWKNIGLWWDSTHTHAAGGSTAWTPKMKPIWFTEFGFPSVDGAANQPNVFVDPTSIESFYPRGSKRRIDLLAQREAINATLDFWQAKNAEAGNADLIPYAFLWTWDARPFPYWPDLREIWADGTNWQTGHWVNGKFGASTLGAIIADLLSQVGLTADTTRLTDPVQGYVINQRHTIRQHLEELRPLYFFDVVESDGQLKFLKRGNQSVITIDHDELVPKENKDVRQTLTITRTQELDLPQRVDVNYINRITNYQSATQTAQRNAGDTEDKQTIGTSIVLSDTEARTIAEKALYVSWFARNRHLSPCRHAMRIWNPPTSSRWM